MKAHPATMAASSYLASIPGFSFEQCSEFCLKIYSVHLAGTVLFYTTTGSFVFSNPKDCKGLEFSANKVSLIELIKVIQGKQ